MHTNQKPIGNMGIAAIMLLSSLTVMVGTALTPALPALGEVYHLGNYVSWLVTAPALGVVATAIFFRKLIDKKGPYAIAVIGIFFYGLLGIIGGFMPNAALLFLDRFLLGAATAAIMSAGVALIANFFEGEKQLKIIALQGMSMEFGGVIFLSVSGMLSDISWKYAFSIYGLGFAALLMIVCFVPKCGAAGASGDSSQSNTGDSMYENPQVDKPKTPVATPKGTPISLVLLIAFFGMLMFFTAMVSLPIYLQTTLGYSPAFTGYFLAALDLVSVLCAGFMPAVVKKVKEKGCLTIAFCGYGTAFTMYLLSGTSPVLLWLGALFTGVGFGFSTPLFNSLVVSKSTPQNKGMHISFCTMAMFSGQFLSALLVSAFSGTTLYFVALAMAFVIMACILPVAKRFGEK
ncbi:MAG: MFS transporter [Emergencia sp.]|jgi:MFS family permease|nr:MFS transporter [Emergencia sp.]